MTNVCAHCAGGGDEADVTLPKIKLLNFSSATFMSAGYAVETFGEKQEELYYFLIVVFLTTQPGTEGTNKSRVKIFNSFCLCFCGFQNDLMTSYHVCGFCTVQFMVIKRSKGQSIF